MRAAVLCAALATGCLDAPPETGGACPEPVAGGRDSRLGDVLTYTFDDDSAATEVAHDSSGNRFDGAFEGGTISDGGKYGDCSGYLGNGVALIEVPDNPLLHLGGAITLETWIWRTRFQTPETLFSIYDPDTDTAELLLALTADDGLVFAVSSGDCDSPDLVSIEVPAASIPHSPGAWFHLAVTWDGATARVYQDGAMVASMPLEATPCPIAQRLSIGATGRDIDPLEAYLDDVKVSSYAKDSEQIDASRTYDPTQEAPHCGDLVLEPGEDCEVSAPCCDPATCRHAASSCGCDGECVVGLCVGDQGRTDDGLVALYDFDEGDGRVAVDTSGSGLDLAIVGDSFSWAPGQLILSGSYLVSSAAADRVVNACRDSQEFSVETWLTPGSPGSKQTIAMLGLGDNCEGFALTRNADRVNAAVWSSLTESDGEPYIDTPESSIGDQLVQLVLTRSADGWRRMYVDGRLVSQSQVGGDLRTWDLSSRLAVGAPVTEVSVSCEKGEAGLWQGGIHLLAVYDRALGAAEVAGNYEAGAENGTSGVR